MSEITAVALPVAEIRVYCQTQPIARLSRLGPGFEAWLRPNKKIGVSIFPKHPKLILIWRDRKAD